MYSDAGGPGRFLRPNHAGSDLEDDDNNNNEPMVPTAKSASPTKGPPQQKDLSAKETDELLRALFARCPS